MKVHCRFFAANFNEVRAEYQAFKIQKDEQGRPLAELALEQLEELEKKGITHPDLKKLKAFLAK